MGISFRNKTVLVTGASSGIGRELALIFAAEASAIVLIGRNKNALLETKAIIGEKSDSSIYVVVEDLGAPDGPINCFRKVNDLGLSVDVLANNAGIGHSNKFLSRTLIEYQTLIQTNISALIAMTHLFLPDMVTRGSGVIINTSSILGQIPMPFLAVYGASKAFVLSFSEALSKEYKGHGISVTAICSPGSPTGFFSAGRVIRENFRWLPMQPPERIAQRAIAGAKKKKRIAYTSLWYASLMHLKRLLPQRVILWILALSYKS